MILSLNSGLSSDNVKNIIISNSTDLGVSGFDGCYEHGLIDIYKSLSSITKNDKVTQIRSFITRFYEQCLGRAPDSGGLDYWTDRLAKGTLTGAQLAYHFVTSREFTSKNVSNQDFVTIMYRAFFDRAPDPGGYSFWLGHLNQGKSRLFVLSGFVGSSEFKNLCTRYGIVAGYITVK